jgi:NAD(P)-dependent dehydrogenase (short-subunit alcohol dehydrogenase family)
VASENLLLTGKVAVVTGASRGIGRAIAEAFVAQGAAVMISSRRGSSLAQVANEIDTAETKTGQIAWFEANAGDAEAAQACVEATVARFGSVDILVNNAATSPYFGPMIDIDVSRAMKMVGVNVVGPIMWTQSAWRAGMRDHGGSVINVASVGGYTVEPDIGFYNVTKAALLHVTRQLAAELGPRVRVNGIAPGLVKTDMSRALWDGREEAIAERLPLQRLGTVADIANAAVFLASEQAAWITGHTIVVDGGSLVDGVIARMRERAASAAKGGSVSRAAVAGLGQGDASAAG